MSPGPQGGLQVERFIGSCLISAHGGHHQHLKGGKNHCSPRPSSSYLFGPREPPPANSYHHPLPHIRNDVYPPPPPPPQHGGWTGAPLFCVASAHNRKARKGPARYQSKTPPEHPAVDDARSPLSRLAIHTQGAPLIQAGRYNRHNYSRNAAPPFRLFRGANSNGVDTSRRDDSPKTPPAKEAPGTCDSVSVASDESSTNSENSLPRIIKPRKRRKKDRKPPPSTQVADVVVQQDDAKTPQSSNDSTSNNEHTVVEPDGQVKEVVVKSTSTPSSHQSSVSNEVVYDDDDLPAGLEQEDDGPATSCQCSYCDPVGVIWDADQRCYSPFLTPPPEAAPPAFFLDGLMLRRSWSEPPSTPPPAPTRTRTHSEPATATPQQQQHSLLEVSSQIITSPNGHRDIEIKFFSSRGPRSFVAEE